MEHEMEIVIPSYQRSETLKKKTLNWLSSANKGAIPVSIFVANRDEYETYHNCLEANSYNDIHIGEVGMKNIRNFINDHYQENARIFQIDDDIYSLTVRRDSKTCDVMKNITPFLECGFDLCEKKKSNLFSVYPVNNPRFMCDEIWVGRFYCMGGAFGVINKKGRHVSVNNKEDYERSLMYAQKDQQIIRFNYIGCDTKGYQGSGGMQSFDRTNPVINEEAEKVVGMYPDICRMRLTKKSGKPEIWIKKQIKERIQRMDV
jgi:hypothetical protein